MYRVKKSAAAVLAAAGIVFAQSVPQWQNLYPAYKGLAFGDGKFAAVSDDGLIRMMGDGGGLLSQRFINDADGNTRSILAAAYGGGRFVAVQNTAKFLQSFNGDAWEAVAGGPPVQTPWKYMVFGSDGMGEKFILIGEGASGPAALFDDFGWDVSKPTGISASHAVFGDGRFVVVGDGGIKSSSDVLASGWKSASSTPVAVAAFDAVGKKFAALSKNGGTACTSADASNWNCGSATGAAADMADMAFGNGKFVAAGKAGKICASSNGTDWTTVAPNPDDDFIAVKFGTNTFVALGAKGSVYTSANGTDWTPVTSGSSAASYKQIAFDGAGKYVAVGDLGVWVSNNGKTWEKKSEETKNLNGVAFGGGRFVAVSANGTITSSANGETWTVDKETGDSLTSVAIGDGVFIAGGRSGSKAAVYKSTDGQDWTGLDLSSNNGWAQGQYVVSLCYGGGKFLAAVGGTNASGALRVTPSSSGEYWNPVENLTAAAGYPMVSTVFADNKFVAVGTKSTGESVVLNSADVAIWQALPLPSEIRGMRSATFANIGGAQTYIAVGDYGNVYASINGSWYLQSKATNRNLSTVYSGGGFVLAAGAKGAMLYSNAPPTSVRHASAPRAAAPSKSGMMSLSRAGRASTVTLSFTPDKAGTIALYSLSGRQLYKTRLGAGERSLRLPERVMPSGSVIVRYSGDGRSVCQRFQVVR